MTMDSTITLGEVSLPAGVVATADPELPVVTVLTMRTPVLDEEEAQETLRLFQEMAELEAMDNPPEIGSKLG